MPGYPRPRNAPPTPLTALAAILGVLPATGDHPEVLEPVLVSGVSHASGEVRPGDLYAALPGRRHHGAAFARDAADRGAVAVLTDDAGARLAADSRLPVLAVADPRAVLGLVADQVYGQPSRRLEVIGITGTAGKTSTAYLIAAGLTAAGQLPGVIGTVETRLGDLVVRSTRTTPEATDLHALLAVAVERGVRTVILEVSSHALVLGRVGGVRFAVGGFTNLGLDHLDFHADTEEYFAAKARLFDGRCAVEIVNLDDPVSGRLIRPGTQTYSAAGAKTATWYPENLVDQGFGQRFTVRGPGGLAVPAGVGLPGRHNVANALLAVASLTAVGVDPRVAGAAVATATGAPGRMERVSVAGPDGDPAAEVLGIVDYAHKPDALVEVLAAVRGLVREPGRIICVLGAGGDRDRGKRPLMGRAASDGADVLIVTDDNPRTEDPAAIRAEVLKGVTIRPGQEVIEQPDRRVALARAVGMARAGDVIAVLGKGHEATQEIAGTAYPFDDRIELAAALRARGTGAGPVAVGTPVGSDDWPGGRPLGGPLDGPDGAR